MSQQNCEITKFEELFPYQVREGHTNLKRNEDSYKLDLLGFLGKVPMLTNQEGPLIVHEDSGSYKAQCVSPTVDVEEPKAPNCLQVASVEEPKPTQSPGVVENLKLTQHTSDVTNSVEKPKPPQNSRSGALNGVENPKPPPSRIDVDNCVENSKAFQSTSVENPKPSQSISSSLKNCAKNPKPTQTNSEAAFNCVENLKLAQNTSDVKNIVKNSKPAQNSDSAALNCVQNQKATLCIDDAVLDCVDNTIPINCETNPKSTQSTAEKLVENLKSISKTPQITPNEPQPTIKGSPLQGKRVIIRTNSMSGEKSLIFKQKTGEKVEIPAKLSSFLKVAGTIKKEVIPVQVHPSNVAHVVFPQSESASRHKPSILKRPTRPILNPEDIKTEDKGIFAEEVVEDVKIHAFDHDYFNYSSIGAVQSEDVTSSSSNSNVPPLAPLSNVIVPKLSPKEDEAFEVDDAVIPIHYINKKISNEERRNQNTSIVADRSVEKIQQTLPLNEEPKLQQNKRSEELITLPKQTNDNQVKKTNYEIVNTNLLKKSKDLTGDNRNTFIVMIANKEMLQQSKGTNKDTSTIFKPMKAPKTKVTPPSFKIPFRPHLKEHKRVQTTETRLLKNVETNTDEYLLNQFIEKRAQERALQNKVTKTTQTDEPPALKESVDERIMITPSPLLLTDPLEFLDLLDGPSLATGIVGENANFGTGPIMGQVHPSFSEQFINNVPTNGKVIENCVGANIMDISHMRGKNICNGGWNAPEKHLNTTTNTWTKIGDNGRPRADSWKVQLFLDLKHCHQFDSSGNMPLHNAVIQNNLNVVRRQCLALRARQIDVNTLNHNSYTALQLALLHEAQVAIVELLLQYGADTSVIDPLGNNVLHICVTNSSESVTKMLLSSTVCADINGINFEGYTPLILCTLNNKYVKADDLLSTGADPNIGDKKSGRTPLFHAVEANDVEMVKLLLNYKAQTRLKNFFGTSPHDAMFELDTIDPIIRNLILNKDEASTPRPKPPEVIRRRKRKQSEDKPYSVKPYGSKNSRAKKARS